jgi:hypothetical protein
MLSGVKTLLTFSLAYYIQAVVKNCKHNNNAHAAGATLGALSSSAFINKP